MLSKKRKTNRKLRKILIPVAALFLFIVTLALLLYHPFLQGKTRSFLSPLGLSQDISLQDMQLKLLKKNIALNTIVDGPDDTVIVTLANSAQVIIAKKKDIDREISSLQLIMTRLTIEGKKFSLVDFRFDKPVIKL